MEKINNMKETTEPTATQLLIYTGSLSDCIGLIEKVYSQPVTISLQSNKGQIKYRVKLNGIPDKYFIIELNNRYSLYQYLNS